MSERQRLLHKVCVAGFAVDEAVLFLDTHPCDKEALAYYEKARDEKNQLVQQYVEQYGPLSADEVFSEECWAWTSAPWPWEWEA